MRSPQAPNWKVKLCGGVKLYRGESFSETRQTSPAKVSYAYLRKRPRAAGSLLQGLYLPASLRAKCGHVTKLLTGT